MRVAFDHQAFSRQKFGGVSRYYARLIAELAEIGCTTQVFAPRYINQYLSELPATMVTGRRLDHIPLWAKPFTRYLNNRISTSEISKWKADVIHETYFSCRPAVAGHTKTVLTVYDMIHEMYPNYFWPWDTTSSNKRLAVERASHIICISECTRQDLIRLFQIDPDKVSTIHLACDSISTTIQSAANNSTAATHQPYLLFVGQRSGYKNFNRLLEAFGTSNTLSKDCVMICFGGGALSRDEKRLISKLKLDGKVIQKSGDDLLLSNLYSSAIAFVYPSLYEGFGLPPLEAMSHRCPVACSHISSIPEVVGDAAVLFDPLNTHSIQSALESILSESGLREQLIHKGTQRLKHFSWRKCAEQTLGIYEKVLG